MLSDSEILEVRRHIKDGLRMLEGLKNHTFTGTGAIPDIEELTFGRALKVIDQYFEEKE
jgi:hypothetical protein